MLRINSLKLDSLTADPVSPVAGQHWFNSTEGVAKYYDGTAIQPYPGAGGAASGGGEEFLFYTDMLVSPADADWSINAAAAAAADTNNGAIRVRLFDDTTEEGVGFSLTIPTGATELLLKLKSRAETAPGSPETVAMTLHYRELPDNGAVGAWSQFDLADLAIPANENFQYDQQTLSLATLSINAGSLYQFELTRNAGDAGDTLAGDLALSEVIASFDTSQLDNYLLYGDQLDFPTDADWDISNPAAGSPDSNNGALTVRRFDDTVQEGVGFLLSVPPGATSLTLREKSRAETAPGAAETVARTLHYRKLADDGSVSAWSTLDLADITMPTNENWQYDEQALDLVSLSIDQGALYQWEISRDTGDAGDTLVGDWTLVELGMEFT